MGEVIAAVLIERQGMVDNEHYMHVVGFTVVWGKAFDSWTESSCKWVTGRSTAEKEEHARTEWKGIDFSML